LESIQNKRIKKENKRKRKLYTTSHKAELLHKKDNQGGQFTAEEHYKYVAVLG
jgi:hypothetical protein